MLKKILTYWRNTLADEDLVTGDVSDGSMLWMPGEATAKSGDLPADVVSGLRSQWRAVLGSLKHDQTAEEAEQEIDPHVVPVVVLARGLAAQHDHGVVKGHHPTNVSFPVVIPATLNSNGRLVPDADHAPWIGRQYLAPTANEDVEIPVIGAVDDFDEWLNANPTGFADWAAVMRWCDGMWAAVTRGQIPPGFVELEGVRVKAAKTDKDLGRNIRQLYDSIIKCGRAPELLSTVCRSTSQKIEIGRKERAKQIGAARGSMGVAHGLADSQAAAVAAMVGLPDGEALAVNGPPGTGKTTLLQS